MPFPSFTPRRALLAAALAAGLSPALSGYTVSGNRYATNGSFADVSAAVGVAVDGDIIQVPAGEYTWGDSGGRLFLTKKVILTGAGSGGAGTPNPATDTIIDLSTTGPVGQNPLINLVAAATVKDMAIHGMGAAVPVFSAGTINGWRITNISYVPYFPNGTSSPGVGSYFCLISGSYGLIDNCHITGASGTNELIFGRGPSNSWQTPHSMGTANVDTATGLPQAVYIEDCVFGGDGYICDANSNARFVVRFCTVTGRLKVDGHGVASNTPARSVRQTEVYDNTWTSSTLSFPAIEIRGGTGMIFGNKLINNTPDRAWFFLTDYGYTSVWPNFGVPLASIAAGKPATLMLSAAMPRDLQTGWLVNVSSPNSTPSLSHLVTTTATVVTPTIITIPVEVDVPGPGGFVSRYQTPLDYPVKDQIGVGEDVTNSGPVAGSEPVYCWDNLAAAANGAGTATIDWDFTWKVIPPDAIATYRSETGNPNATFTMQDVIKADHDYFKGIAGKETVAQGFNGSSGVGVGTFAEMKSITPTKAGVGFWVTDQADWNKKVSGADGQLYVWNGSAWVVKYTPFTYPHPLRAPAAPTNLRIQGVP